ncbi:MAG: hypothetical protein Kow0027_04470 [Saprospiraceae bacterium]|nr:hypothetical protein [Saprospirales bacterium]
MKELIVQIPEDKLSFFKELMKQLGLEIKEEATIPAEVVSAVRERISSIDKSSLEDWEDVKKSLES